MDDRDTPASVFKIDENATVGWPVARIPREVFLLISLSRAFINFARNLASTRRPIFLENEETPERIGCFLFRAASRARGPSSSLGLSDYVLPFLLALLCLRKYEQFTSFAGVQAFILQIVKWFAVSSFSWTFLSFSRLFFLVY